MKFFVLFTSGIFFILLNFLLIFTTSASLLPSQWKNINDRVTEFQEPVKGDTSQEMLNTLFRKNIIPIAKFVFIGLSLVFIAIYAYKMAIGTGEESQMTEQRTNILFAILGFSVLGISAEVIEIVNPIRENSTNELIDKDKVDSTLQSIINFMELGLGAIAVILIFYGGIKLITANGDDEALTSAKNILLYGFLGVIIVMLADPLITQVFYPDLGNGDVGDESAGNFVAQGFGLLKFFLQFMAIIIFIAFIYAGFLYILAGDNDDQTSTAKKILIWSLVGVVIILLSYSIVMFFVPS
jgi:hypothetical protein